MKAINTQVPSYILPMKQKSSNYVPKYFRFVQVCFDLSSCRFASIYPGIEDDEDCLTIDELYLLHFPIIREISWAFENCQLKIFAPIGHHHFVDKYALIHFLSDNLLPIFGDLPFGFFLSTNVTSDDSTEAEQGLIISLLQLPTIKRKGQLAIEIEFGWNSSNNLLEKSLQFVMEPRICNDERRSLSICFKDGFSRHSVPLNFTELDMLKTVCKL